MAITLINGSFKVQAGVINSVENLIPEKGAIIFDEETNTIKVGDGFNWRPLPVTDFSALGVTLETETDTVLVGGVSQEPFTFFDTVAYQQGTDIVPTIGDTITIGANMVADFAANLQASCSVKNVSVLLLAQVGASVVSTRELFFGQRNTFLTWDWTNRATLVAADVITLKIFCDTDCTFSLRNLRFGFNQLSN